MPKKGSLKVTKFHGDSVKNESARTKNYRGGAPNAPSPACLGLKPAKLSCLVDVTNKNATSPPYGNTFNCYGQ